MSTGTLPLVAKMVLGLLGCAPDDPISLAPDTGNDAETAALTYHRDVAPILQNNCVSCHYEGGPGGLALDNYRDAYIYQSLIEDRILDLGGEGEMMMPPNTATTSAACPSHPVFLNEHKLSEREIRTLVNWIQDGAPEGDPATAAPLDLVEDYHLSGAVVYPNTTGYARPAGGTKDTADSYQCFAVDPGAEMGPNGYFDGFEVLTDPARGGNPAMVHHVLLFEDPSRASDALVEAGTNRYECKDGAGVGSILGGWVPGQEPLEAPAGTAFQLKPGSKLVYQIHYHVHDISQDAEDHTGIAIRWTKRQPSQLARIALLGNYENDAPQGGTGSLTGELSIPPNMKPDEEWVEKGQTVFRANPYWTGPNMTLQNFPEGMEFPLWSVGGHQHTYGRRVTLHLDSASATASRPGTAQKKAPNPGRCLLEVKWNFAWQQLFLMDPATSPRIREGDRLTLECGFNNPGPDPIGLSETSDGEMCLAVIGYLVPL